MTTRLNRTLIAHLDKDFPTRAEMLGIYYAASLGIVGDGATDVAPMIRAAVASNRTIIFPPGTYLLDSTSGAIPGVATAPAIVLDGIRNFSLIGMPGAIFKIGPNLAALNSSFVLTMVSEEQAAAGNYTQNIRISGMKLAYSAAPGLTGNVAGLNITSAERVLVEDVEFDASALVGTGIGVFGITGTGGRGHMFRENLFRGVSTAFDNSQYEKCTFLENVLVGDTNAVTGFNHFYDNTTLSNIRLERPLSQPVSSALRFIGNEVCGYPSSLSLRGLRDSWVENNQCHSVSINDSNVHNAISVYTDANEFAAGYHVSNISITRNVIYGLANAGTGTMRGIFVNRFGNARPVSSVTMSGNKIHDITSGGSAIGISFDNISDGDQIGENSIDPATVATPYGQNVMQLLPGAQNGYSPTLQASAGDLILKPGAGRRVRFGTFVAATGLSIVGYEEIAEEATGTTRRVAIVG